MTAENVRPPFDVDRLIATSKKMETDDIDWSDVPNHPLTEGEVRVLTYMMDVESYTIVFLKELLTDEAMRDDELAGFLSVWGYEEYFHGWSLRKFLRAYGVPIADGRGGEIQAKRDWLYHLRYVGQKLLTKLAGSHFLGVHMAGGAINELTTAEAYNCVARRTQHPILRTLLHRIMRDERRHYTFYFQQAAKRLMHPVTRAFTAFIVDRFLDPVGANLRPDPEVTFASYFIFGDAFGAHSATQVDESFAKLPGFADTRWFRRSLERNLSRLRPEDRALAERDWATLALAPLADPGRVLVESGFGD